MMKPSVYGLNEQAWKNWMAEHGHPSFRASQLYRGLMKDKKTVDEITNIDKALKAELNDCFDTSLPTVERKLISQIDGTVKYLFALGDGNCVECVVMRYEHGTTVCISSQVGCRMGCKFCASTLGGKVRDLSAGELIGEVFAAERDLGERIDGLVMMGIGEPLDNYDNVVAFLRLITDPNGAGIGARHVSLSTCGLVDRIDRLAEEDLAITLSISLHAPDDETRSAIMPVNKRYGVEALLGACKRYFEKTGRRISFEYTLIAGKNDSPAQAEKLASVLNRHLRSRTDTMPIHVNLIPVNEVEETAFKRASAEAVKKFAQTLERYGVRATVRRKLGADIAAACGQLRRNVVREKEAADGTN